VILNLLLAEKQYKPPAAKKQNRLLKKKTSAVPYLKCKPLGFISINYEMAYYTSLKSISMLNVDDQLKRFAKFAFKSQLNV